MSKKVRRASVLFSLLLFVVACTTPTTPPADSPATQERVGGGVAQPTTAPSETPTPTTVSSDPATPTVEASEVREDVWENPYEQVKAELCGPDAPAEETPFFVEPLPVRVEQAGAVQEVWIQRGLFANQQGELFRVEVMGSNPDIVARYSGELRLCLDQLFTGEIAQPQEAPPAPEQPALPERFGENEEDLIIEIYLVGFLGPQDNAPALLERLRTIPMEEWAVSFRELGLLPEQARPEQANQTYMVDFIIDPSVSGGGTHRYAEKYGVKAVSATVSVENGSGSVRGTLCRNGVALFGTTVTKGGTQSAELSHNSLVPVTYDFGVTGNSNGTYRVSGRWGVEGWSASYLSTYVPGGSFNCPP